MHMMRLHDPLILLQGSFARHNSSNRAQPAKLAIINQMEEVIVTRRAVTDLGGLPAGPIDRHEHEPTMTERRIDAMMMLLRQKPNPLVISDENRRTIESLSPEFYEGSAYYERWVAAMHFLMVEKGVLSEAEVEKKLAEVKSRYADQEASR